MTDIEAALLDVLRAGTAEPALAFDGTPQRLSGGFWAELVGFRLRVPPPGWPHALVLRLMPDAATGAKETAIQSVVAGQGLPTPVVRLAGGPGEGFDRRFMIMDRADGAPLLGDLDARSAIATVPTLLRRLPAVLADAMAHLHRLDPAPVYDRLGADAPTLHRHLDGLEQSATECGRTDLATAARWFRAHAPPAARAVICHGDLHPLNVLVADSGRVTVLDWSAARLAPAAFDVGVTNLLLSEPPIAVPAALRPVIRAAGRLLAWRFRRAYASRAGTSIDARTLRWYEAVTCLRALIEVAQWADDVQRRAGHPWLVCGDAFARRLSRLTGAPVRPR